MAVRYDQKTKDAVVKFIVDYNSKNNGRGGQSAAAKKFKVTPITISSWMKKAGVKGANKKKRATRKTTGGGGSKSSVLNRLLKVQSQIESLESEYEALKKQL